MLNIRFLWLGLIDLFFVLMFLPGVKMFYFSQGLRWQYILLFAFFGAYALTPLCRAAALKLRILDNPDQRKIHDRPTPLLGGAAIYCAFTAAILLNGVFLEGMKAVLTGAGLILFMGLWDDARPIPASVKLILQILITVFVIVWGDIQLTFFYRAPWGAIIDVPLTVVWIVGLTNAVNFFDGIDGLATVMSMISAFFLGIIAFNTHQPALGWFAVALLGACLGFLPYNFRIGRSARLFLGDAGSTFLGFTLAGLAVLGRWSNTSHFVSLAAPVLIFAVLIFDMIYVTLSRIKNRQADNAFDLLMRPSRDHLHHRLLFLGFKHKEVVYIIATLSTCLGVSALIIMEQQLIHALLGIFQAVLICGLIVALMLRGRERVLPEGDRRMLRRRREDRQGE